jgi:hypothetical protein
MRWEEYEDYLIEKEKRDMQMVADYLGKPVEEIGWGKTLEEKLPEFKSLIKGWIMTKPNGEEFTKVVKVKAHKVKRKKKGKTYENEYGRIQISVPPEWVGYSAKVIVSKKVTPKVVYNFEGEIHIEDLADGVDPSDLVEIVEEENETEDKKNDLEAELKRSHPDWTDDDFREISD